MHAGRDEPAEQSGDEHGVARVVQLELIDAQQAVVRKRLDRGGKPESAHQVGDLDERAVGLGARGGMPESGKQVRLADAEPTVQVDARTAHRGACPTEPPSRGRREPPGEVLQNPDGPRLRGLFRIRQVGLEPGGVEVRRRDE